MVGTAIRVVELSAAATDPAVIARAGDDLQRLPGVGAVVVCGPSGEPAAVVTYEYFARRAAADRWLASLLAFLAAKSYAVVDQELQLWAPTVPARSFRLLRTVARRSLNLARVPLHQRAARGRRRWRRRHFLARLRWEAWLAGTELELRVAKDLFVEPGVRFQLAPGRAVLEIGPRCRLLGGTILRLRGELIIGAGVEIRHDASINVKGRLELRGRNVVAKGAMLHADGTQIWEWGSMIAEYATALDSHHDADGSLVQLLDQGVQAFPITIGAGSLVGAKATIMPGVTVGRGCIIGAGSVVTRDVPAGATVVGIPAKPIRT